jgi:hypothetical protein
MLYPAELRAQKDQKVVGRQIMAISNGVAVGRRRWRERERQRLFADALLQFPHAQRGQKERLGASQAAGGGKRWVDLGPGGAFGAFTAFGSPGFSHPAGGGFADWEMSVHGLWFLAASTPASSRAAASNR